MTTSNGVLPFSQEYDKLDHAVFPTLRRYDRYGSVGDTNDVMVGDKGNREFRGEATVVAKETVTIKSLNPFFFMFDTQTDNFHQALDSINSFYQNPIGEDEELTLYWNLWKEW